MLHPSRSQQKKQFVNIPLILEFRSLTDKRLLLKQHLSIRWRIDAPGWAMLQQARLELNQSYEVTVLQHLAAVLTTTELLQHLHKQYPNLPPFSLAVGRLWGTITWDDGHTQRPRRKGKTAW